MTSLLSLRAVDGGVVVDGAACPNGCTRSAVPVARCAECGSATEPAAFGPAGRVWASTVVRVPAGDRPPGRRIAFVDLDDGPRVVCDLPDATPLEAAVRLAAISDAGDPVAVTA